MSSVETSVVCPQCGYPDAHEEFQTRNYTTDTFCPRCGFHSVEKPDTMDVVEAGHGAYFIYEVGEGGVMGRLPEDQKERRRTIKSILLKRKKNPTWRIDLFVVEGRTVKPMLYSEESKAWDKELKWRC
jgi:DNA-directed RNA polymerase subunit RPC12/RpoP